MTLSERCFSNSTKKYLPHSMMTNPIFLSKLVKMMSSCCGSVCNTCSCYFLRFDSGLVQWCLFCFMGIFQNLLDILLLLGGFGVVLA